LRIWLCTNPDVTGLIHLDGITLAQDDSIIDVCKAEITNDNITGAILDIKTFTFKTELAPTPTIVLFDATNNGVVPAVS